MYSSAEEDNENLFEEVEYLGELLGKRDGVPYDAKHNRLTQLLKITKQSLPIIWKAIEHLND
jgi:predicted transcriptional regulator